MNEQLFIIGVVPYITFLLQFFNNKIYNKLHPEKARQRTKKYYDNLKLKNPN